MSNATKTSGLYSKECLDALERWDGIDGPPDAANRVNKEGIPIFKSPILELGLTKAPPILPWIFSLPIIAGGLYWGHEKQGLGFLTLGILLVLGVLLWTFIEYMLHRYMFHFVPKNKALKTFFFLTHGYHHEFPDDKLRLVAPPLMYWSLFLVFSTTYFLLFGQRFWAPLFAGTVIGYLGYDMVHYYSHHARPKSGIGKWLRSYHLLHHFSDSETRYGISTPLWDFVFGTFRPPTKAGREE